MSGPAHVLVLRPIIERLRERGHEVLITARVYTQTLELLDLHGMEYTLIGKPGGASRIKKLMRLIQRTGGKARRRKRAGLPHPTPPGAERHLDAPPAPRIPRGEVARP